VILFVLANKLTTAANAILLQYSAPIYVALFGAWFLNERATGLDWLTIIFVMGGMLLFFLDDLTGGNRWGNICAMPDAKGWIGLLLLGVFQLGLPYILYTAAIKHLAALEASLIPVLEALLNPLWVFLLIGETPGWWAVVGGMIVLGAVTARGVIMTKFQTEFSRRLNLGRRTQTISPEHS
jgi:drug/metabolite transporter (DMT)-like permease